MSEFRVAKYEGIAMDERWVVRDEGMNHLHCDGSVYHMCPEYWPTREQAQAVLDKHRPHVWKHGDVFRRKSGAVDIYIMLNAGPIVYNLRSKYYRGHPGTAAPDYKVCLADAKFLFNIKDKLDE
jgi:hypothetical protein